MHFFSRSISLSSLIKLFACLSIALGATVIYGWLSHNVALIQVNSAFVAKQFNTALGFFLVGVGLCSALSKRTDDKNTTGEKRPETKLFTKLPIFTGWFSFVLGSLMPK